MQTPKKEVILPKGGAKPVAPYSPGIRVGQFVFTAGQIALDPETGQLVEGGIQAETRQALTNLKAILEAAGSSLDDAVKVTVFIKDMDDFGAVNEVYGNFFKENPPARSAVQSAKLPLGASVMIEAVALVKDSVNAS
jgi:2-iminobutanoate/2-iminopropanoate deaminase